MRGPIMLVLLAAGTSLPSIAHAQVAEAATNPASAQTQTTAGPVATETDVATDTATDEIVVTAQKRSENLQDVPISITALNAATLTEANVTSLTDLKRLAPTFRFNPTSGTGVTGARLSIRGIGSFTNNAVEPSVGTFLDGFYIPRPASIGRTFLDIASVEIISGPQGTLFGRNASAGALSLRSALPKKDFSGSLDVRVSSGAHYRGEGYVNVPVSEGTSFRFAGLIEKFGGQWRNTLDGRRFGGVDNFAGRATLLSELSGNLTLILRGDYTKQTGVATNNWKLRPFTLTPVTAARLTAAQGGIPLDLDQYGRGNNFFMGEYDIDADHWGVSSTLQWEPGGGFDVNLLSSYRDWRTDQSDGDVAILAVPVVGRDQFWISKSYSNELQIISPARQLLDGRLNFVLGLYQFHEDLGITYNTNFLANFCQTIVTAVRPTLVGACLAGQQRDAVSAPFFQKTDSYAAYGQATFTVLPPIDITLGGRFTRDRKTATATTIVNNPLGILFGAAERTDLRRVDKKFTWRATITGRVNDDVNVYATYSTGFKSGGFNSNSSNPALGQARAFDPEDVDNYEIGLKSTLFDRALTFNVAAYRMRLDGLQDRSVSSLGINTVRNVGSVRHQGVEAQGTLRATEWLRLNANVAYLDAVFLDYRNAPGLPWIGGVQDLTGRRPPFTPKWAGSVGPEIEAPVTSSGISFRFRSELSFFSTQNVGAVNDGSPLFIQRGYALLGARATIAGPDDRWSVAVFGDNLTDKGYCDDTLYQVFEGPLGLRTPTMTATRCSVGAPRSIGVAGTVRF